MTKKVMNAKIPRACPRGPQRRAYTPAHTTARNASVARERVRRAARSPAPAPGNRRAGSSAVVSAWPRTVASVTVKSASSAARPPVMAAGERVPGEPGDGHGEADAEDGPGRVAQPQPPRVRSHEHPLQHRLALPTVSWHEKGAAGSAAPSTGFMTASEPHPAQLMAICLCHWHSPAPFWCAIGTPMDDAGPDRPTHLAQARSRMLPGGRPGLPPRPMRRAAREDAVPVTAASLLHTVRADAVERAPLRPPPKAKTAQRDR